MLIAIDASRANRLQKTGVEWYVYHLIFALSKLADKNDTFILYFQDKPQAQFYHLPENFKLKVLNWPPKILWTHLRLSWQILKDNPDCLLILAHVIPLFHPKNTLTTLHDVAFKLYPKVYSRFENFYQNFAVKFALKHAKKIICPSFFTKKEILKYYPAQPEQLTVIYNGFDQKSFVWETNKEKLAQILIKYHLPNNYFIYIGRKEEKKNLINIINAFEIYKKETNSDINLLLIGKEGFGYEKIAAYIKNSPFQKNILQLSWVNETELSLLWQQAKIFLYVTRYEGFGLPILESFALKVPVITSNFGACQEIGATAASLANPEKPTDIAAKMKDLMTNETWRQELIIRGQQRCLSFSWAQCAAKIYTLLKETVAK